MRGRPRQFADRAGSIFRPHWPTLTNLATFVQEAVAILIGALTLTGSRLYTTGATWSLRYYGANATGPTGQLGTTGIGRECRIVPGFATHHNQRIANHLPAFRNCSGKLEDGG
jgi:hypothetical protein